MKNNNHKFVVSLCAVFAVLFSLPAQTVMPPSTPAYAPLSDQQLDQLLEPIALYPDPLIAQILPAATMPTQIVLADRYLSEGGDTNQIESQPWDSSVQALAHYPTVLKWMDDNLNWTTELGQAFLNQQQTVMSSIQRLRAKAESLGNLKSTPQQEIVNANDQIEILPAEPQVIYVPVYDPNLVFFQAPISAPFITFGLGFGIGPWLNCDFDWPHHDLIVWNQSYRRPANWWRRPSAHRDAFMSRHGKVWHPVNHPGFVGSNRGSRGWFDNPATHRPSPFHHAPNSNFHNSGFHRNNSVPARNFHPKNSSPDSVKRTFHNHPPGKFTSPPQYPHYHNTFGGVQNSRQSRNFSRHGSVGVRNVPHSAPSHPAPSFAPHHSPPPVSHSAPSANGNGNSGGSHHGGGDGRGWHGGRR